MVYRYPISERVEAVPVEALEKGISVFEKVKYAGN